MTKTAIVTGASKGLGYAITRRLVKEGVHVIAGARSRDLLQSLTKEAPKFIHPYTCDVTQADQVEGMIQYALEQTGQIDYVINNAGLGRFGPLEELSEADWDEMMNVNVKGVFLTSAKAIPYLKQSKGHIVNISSIAGSVAFAGGGGYCASKAAVNMLSDTLTQELKPHEVRVTNLSPGSIKTEFHHPKDYALPPDEVAEVVWSIISAPRHMIIGELTIRPQVPPK